MTSKTFEAGLQGLSSTVVRPSFPMTPGLKKGVDMKFLLK